MSRPAQRLHLLHERVEVPLLRELSFGGVGHSGLDHLADPLAHVIGEILTVEHAATLLVDDGALRVHHVVVLEGRSYARRSSAPRPSSARSRSWERIPASIGSCSGSLKRSMIPWIRSAKRRTGRPWPRGRSATRPGRPGAPSGRAASCRSGAPRAARSRARRDRSFAHALAELDVHAAVSHVRRDRDRARLATSLMISDSRSCSFAFRTLCGMPRRFRRLGEELGRLDRDRADEHGLSRLMALLDVLDHGVELRVFRLEDEVVLVGARDGHVRRDLDDVEVVDLDELLLLRFRGAGHPGGELLVEAEVVLQRDRSRRLVLLLDRTPSFASTAWWRPSLQRRPSMIRPVNSSTILTSPSWMT